LPIPDERPVMDVANDNNPIRTSFDVPVDIPASKVAARAWLEAAMASAPAITVCKYRPPRGPNKWKPRKIAANDNTPHGIPLIEELRRDGRESDISWVLRYRLLYEVVGASPFDDEIGLGEKGINIEARSLNPGGAAFSNSFNRMTTTTLPGGEISYREPRQTVKQRVSIGQRTIAANDNSDTRTQAPLRLMKSEDERIARIDGEPILAALRVGIGEWLTPFEDAVLDGLTLTEIGDGLGFKWKARSAEAKWRVYLAIDQMRDQWRLIERQMAAEAAACNRRVEARRAELAAERAAYLGLAA
jgi:hypothetical protein